MILKGQNFRILTFDSTANKYKVVGMSSGCSVSLNGNTEDSNTKDDVNMAAKPVVISKSWSVTVESLNVADAGAMLTAIKNLTPFTLLWDETETSDNQTAKGEGYARTGTAYLSDVTFNWNDRENATKSLQFTGTSALSTVSQAPSTDVIDLGSYTKGQYVRLYLSNNNSTAPSKVIAAAKQLSLHVSMSMESATTKDTTGDWDIQEPTALSYDITTNALVKSGETITSSVSAQALSDIETIFEASEPVKWQIANTSGANQRTKGAIIASGSVVVSSLTLNGPNRQNADYTAQLSGYGTYTVGA